MHLQRAPILRVLVPFSAGLLVGQLTGTGANPTFLFPAVVGCWMLLLLLYGIRRWLNRSPGLLFAAAAFVLMALTGYGNGMLAGPEDPGLPVGERVIIEGVINEAPSPGSRSWNLEIGVNRLCASHAAYGVRTVVRAYMEMPADSILPEEGEYWRMCGALSAIRNSGNPGETDYESVMQRQGIWYNFFVDPADEINIAVEQPSGMRFRAARLRRSVSGHWKGDPEELSLLKAVCLGDRSGITDDLRQSYSDAGGMHLLAVSGLHVGLIWWFLHHLLAWMTRLFRGEACRSLTIILLLWCYACVAGFSSSVSRAVTMYTFISVSGLAGRRSGTLNAILVSAFFLLLLKPGRILDVGFQLSYAAVLGIVTIFPAIRGRFNTKNRLLAWIRDAALVSLSAQISTAPLAAFYFHKLPVYAIFTNLLAIPLLSGLISIFLISVPFIYAGVLPGVFNWMLTGGARLMNRSMDLVASLPGSTIGELHPGPVSVAAILILLVTGMIALNVRDTGPRYLLLILLSFQFFWSSWSRYCRLVSGEFAVSHYSGCSVVTFREGYRVDHYIFCRDSSSLEWAERGIMRTWDERKYEIRRYMQDKPEQFCGQVSAIVPAGDGSYLVGNNRFRGWIIAGGAGRVPKQIPRQGGADFILLSGEPAFPDLDFPEKENGPVLILDGSNRSWYLRRVRESVQEAHETGLEGAYLKRW